jgi:hypothetical protein
MMRIRIQDPGWKNQIRDSGSATLLLLNIIATTEIQREIMNKNDLTLQKIFPAKNLAPFRQNAGEFAKKNLLVLSHFNGSLMN